MFSILFFIPPFVFLLLAITFTICISKIEKIPSTVTVSIGKLNADDIRKLDKKTRDYLRNQTLYYFVMAVIVTFINSLTFIILGYADNGMLASPCNLIGTIAGMVIVFRLLKKANALKEEIIKAEENKRRMFNE